MKFKSLAALSVLLVAVSAQSADLDVVQYSVNYDETTSFGSLSSWGGGGNNVSFTWTVPNSVQVVSAGALEILAVDLPSFTVTAKPGWALGGLSAFLGNLSYFQLGGATTGILWYATVSVDGGPAVPLSGGVPWVETSSAPGFQLGYFGGQLDAPSSSFTTFSVSNASIALSATDGTFSSIAAQPQNRLEIGFTAVPVPEPETYAMMLAGLAALGWLTMRRRAQG